jgi:putative flippase GtrA
VTQATGVAQPPMPVAAGGGLFVADLVRYGAASGAALACDYAVLIGLLGAGLHYLMASAIGFSAGIVVAYLMSIRFVFPARRGADRMREAAGFLAVGLAGLLLTQVLLFVLVSGFTIVVPLAKTLTSGAVFFFNFLLRRSLVFRKG